MSSSAANVDARPYTINVPVECQRLEADFTCTCDPSIAMSLPYRSTVDKATCTGDLHGIPFICGETAIVQTDIALHTHAQCQIYIPVLNRYAKSLKKEGLVINPTVFISDCPGAQLDPIKILHDLETLRMQNEKLVEQILICRRELEEQGKTIYTLSKENGRLIAEKEDLQVKLRRFSNQKDEALISAKQAQETRYESPEFVLRDEGGGILFDERLLPSDSEAIIHIVKANGVITYHIYAEMNEFLSQQRKRPSIRNVKLQIGASFLHMNT